MEQKGRSPSKSKSEREPGKPRKMMEKQHKAKRGRHPGWPEIFP
jgi:hypothetical protein